MISAGLVLPETLIIVPLKEMVKGLRKLFLKISQ